MQEPSSTPTTRPASAAPEAATALTPPSPPPLTTLVPQVVVPALLVLGGLLVFCSLFPQRADLFFTGAQSRVVGHFDWFYTSAVTVFLVFLLMVAVSRAVPVFIVREAARETERDQVFEPMTFFEDGRQGYDIQYLRPEEIIVDILRHYERYRTVSINQQTQLLNRAPGHTDPLPHPPARVRFP